MTMNHRHKARRAYVEYRVTVDPAALTPLKPYWLSVVPCVSDPQYTVPGGGAPGSVDRRSKTITMPEAGRIVAIGGHLHGGAHELRVTQPACDKRTLVVNDPTYGAPGDPLYAVRPLLHEPDPKSISWTQWSDGWAIRAGEKLRVTAAYDGSRPHMRVMGIAHVYLTPDAALRWRFRDRFIHDATVVTGPRGFATETVRGRDQRHRFRVPGEYRLYCSIHPVLMSQVVKVRRGG